MSKAYYVESANKLVMKEHTLKPLSNTDVKVKVRAVSLNYRDLLNLEFGSDQRFIAMSDGAGEVVAIGEDVTDLKVGDRVTGLFFPRWIDGAINMEVHSYARGGAGEDGMLAEEVVGKSESFIKFPDYMTYQEAATLPCAGVAAWNALFEYADLKPGETIVIQGSGGVALFALQLAKTIGSKVIVLSSKKDKTDYLKSLGADHVINYRTTPEWQDQVMELTNGKGADLILELGGAGTLPRSMQAAKVNGNISVIGVLSGLDGEVNPLPIIVKSLRLHGVYVGSKAMQQRLHNALAQNKIKPVIDIKTFAFEKAQEAYDYQRSGKHLGNIVIDI
jgi:NADPH:quinone reductase-like Zn-dependent oxidoreductase